MGGLPRVVAAAFVLAGANSAALAQYGPATIPAWQAASLVQALDDPDSSVRSAVLRWAAEHDSSDPVLASELARLAATMEGDERTLALQALSRSGSQTIVHEAVLLQALADHRNPRSQVAAMEGLLRIGRENSAIIETAVRLFEERDEELRVNLMRLVPRMGQSGHRFVPLLTSLMAEIVSRRGQRGTTELETMQEILVELATVEANVAEPLTLLLASESPYVQIAAMETFAKIGRAPPAAIERLNVLLDDAAPEIATSAAITLAEVGQHTEKVVRAVKRGTDASQISWSTASAAHLLSAADAQAYAGRLLAQPRGSREFAQTLGGIASAHRSVADMLAARSTSSIRDDLAPLWFMTANESAFTAKLKTLLAQPVEGWADPRQRVDEAISIVAADPVAFAELAPALEQYAKSREFRANPYVASSVTKALHALRRDTRDAVSALADMLGASERPRHGSEIVRALRELGVSALSAAPAIANQLGSGEPQLRQEAFQALLEIAVRSPTELPIGVSLKSIEAATQWRGEESAFRFAAYLFSSPGQNTVALRWLGKRTADQRPKAAALTRSEALNDIDSLRALWPSAKDSDSVRAEIANSLSEIIVGRTWTLEDVPRLAAVRDDLLGAGELVQNARFGVERAMEQLTVYQRLKVAAGAIGAHVALWTLLLFAYQRSLWVQSFFFWNRWARQFLGLGYVGLLITHVPFLRRHMLAPFSASLVTLRVREQFSEVAFYPGLRLARIKGRAQEEEQLATEVISRARQQLVIVGESGLGKTVLLSWWAAHCPRPVVFLHAAECEGGVVEAIQRKVQGVVQDTTFLASLIHAGGLDVLIDAVNEAKPDVRLALARFTETYFRGSIIITTQPMEWKSPDTALLYRLLPLKFTEIRDFMASQWDVVRDRATLTKAQYLARIDEYVAQQMAQQGNDGAQALLSNPLEAALAADLIARGRQPEINRILEQRVSEMARDFADKYGRAFPFAEFAEFAYQVRLSRETIFADEKFVEVVRSLVKHKLALVKGEQVGDAIQLRYMFRHERIGDLFIVPAFLGREKLVSERVEQHMADARFSGVYDLLARALTAAQLAAVHKRMVERAADTGDNESLNRFTRASRDRDRLGPIEIPGMQSQTI